MHLPLLAGSIVQPQSEVSYSSAPNKRLLVVVADVDIEDVDWTIELAAFVVQVVEDGIEAALLARYDDVNDAGFGSCGALVLGVVEPRLAGHPVLESLGIGLDIEVPAEHVEQTILRVQMRVLLGQLLMDGLVRCTVEVVDVRRGNGRTGQPHKGARAE